MNRACPDLEEGIDPCGRHIISGMWSGMGGGLMEPQTLESYLKDHAAGDMPNAKEVAETVEALSRGAIEMRDIINQGVLGSAFATAQETENPDGDVQKGLDVLADDAFLNIVRKVPVALYASEELDHPVLVNEKAPLGLAIDPLDGSSNIDANVSIGTIFAIMPVKDDPAEHPAATFLQPGTEQLGAGFFIYGPQLALALTLGTGTNVFVYSNRHQAFVRAYEGLEVPHHTHEFAINASNFQHWEAPVRAYVDDCLAGLDGPREKKFNMRWVASLVAECYRIMMRGGVFLYPGDQRKGYAHGRLRIVYEANPIAFLIEQAGGAAIDSVGRILEIHPHNIHQRVPLIFGSRDEVRQIQRYHTEESAMAHRSPLFGKRGLFRV